MITPQEAAQRPFDSEGMRKLATIITPFAGEAVLQCVNEIERLRAALANEPQAERHIPTPDDIEAQDWAGMDGAIAYHLIDRHSENWGHAGRLMHAWRDANPPSVEQPGAVGDERTVFEAWARQNGYQYDELARCKIGVVSPEFYNMNTENAFRAFRAGAKANVRPNASEGYGSMDMSYTFALTQRQETLRLLSWITRIFGNDHPAYDDVQALAAALAAAQPVAAGLSDQAARLGLADDIRTVRAVLGIGTKGGKP